MQSFFDGCFNTFTFSVITLLTLLIIYIVHHFNYWKNKGIPYIRGTFPFGSLKQLIFLKVSLVELFNDFYNQFDSKYIGFYSFFSPQLLIKDLDLVKTILVRDFSDFTSRGLYYNGEVDPLSVNLFSLGGNEWRSLRTKLSPVYSTGKMKIMYPTVKQCAIELQKFGATLLQKDDVVEIKDITSRYSLDVISSTALGIEGNNFLEDNTDMRRASNFFIKPSMVQLARFVLVVMCKSLAKLLRMRFISKEVEQYFINVVKANTEYRESNNIKRNDFMQLLIEMKNGQNESTTILNSDSAVDKECNDHLTLEEMAAQSLIFVTAGYETSSVTLGFCLYELALNPQMQERLVNELQEAGGEDIPYEVLQQLPYLEMVVCETLRKYPPLAILQRECSRDYTLPDGKVIDKGTMVIIPVIGFHHDPKLFPNPDVFDPERFSKENIHKIVPYSYLPFGEGPRICIGMRFGKMQVKLALATLLSRFSVTVCEKTQIPMKIDKKTFTYNAEGGVWLRVIERTNSSNL